MLKQGKNDGVKLTHKLVLKYKKNLPAVPLFPKEVYSSNDITTYCYEGKGEKYIFMLVGSNTMRIVGSCFCYCYGPGVTKHTIMV